MQICKNQGLYVKGLKAYRGLKVNLNPDKKIDKKKSIQASSKIQIIIFHTHFLKKKSLSDVWFEW